MSGGIVIREIDEADLPPLASLHAEALPNDFCSLLGRRFLTEILYPALLENAVAALCAVDEEGAVAGFVIFQANDGFFRKLARQRFGRLAGAAALRAWDPRFVAYSARVLWLVLNEGSAPPGVELAYIAVKQPARGTGIGSALVTAGLERLQAQRIDRCWVKTLLSTPANIQFYERLGFTHVATSLGRVYLSRAVTEAPTAQTAFTPARDGGR